MRRGPTLLIASLLALALAPAALGKSETVKVHDVAAALEKDPVYVAPGVRKLLPPRDARRLRRKIASLDKGRIQVAVVPAASAERVGGIRSFGNAVDQAIPNRRGDLIATTGNDFQLVTSHSGVDTSLSALRRAIETHQHDSLATQLLASVDGLADVDPGPSADVNGPPGGGSAAGSSGGGGGGSDVGAIVGIVLGALVLIPLLGFGIWGLLRWRKRRRASSDLAELDLGSARDELLALGQEIEELDLDTQMPGASPAGRDEYQRALMLYDRGNRALTDKDPSDVQIYEAKRAAEEGRARIQAARNLLNTSPTPPTPGS